MGIIAGYLILYLGFYKVKSSEIEDIEILIEGIHVISYQIAKN